MMAELCHFYNGWTFVYVRTMTMSDFDTAYKYMVDTRKSENQEGGQRGGRRQSSTSSRYRR